MRRSSLGYQRTFFEVARIDQVVNVASVPKRSPFRYPGGKTWLIPRIREWLAGLETKPNVLVEPFAGGAIVGLTAAFEELVDHVVLVELDEQVAAVWKTILGGGANWLAERILTFELSPENVRETLSRNGGGVREQAFRTILKNRTFHGGILAPGATFIKYGENGKGLKSRWYPETLAKRITAIGRIRKRFTFVHGDGLSVMCEHARNRRAVFFVDPPYSAGGARGKRAGTRLYVHHALDHRQLFQLASEVVGDFLLTYDDAPDVRALAGRHSFDVERVAMKNTHHALMTELLIGRDLTWARPTVGASFEFRKVGESN